MKRVIIESPYAGDIERNIKYAKRCMWDSLNRGEAPFLSHLLYPQVLDDTKPDERKMGIEAGFKWGKVADLTAVYVDYGITPGMGDGIIEAWKQGRDIAFREIGGGLPMTNYNPIYLCFCKATGRKPEEATAHQYVRWVMEQQKIYMQGREIVKKYFKGHLPEAHADAFHAWLKRKYLSGDTE